MPALRVAAALALLLGAACAGDMHWDRPCATAADLEADREACMAASGNDSGVMNWSTSRFLEGCLRDRGWRRYPVGRRAACPDRPPAESAAPAAPEPTGAPRHPGRAEPGEDAASPPIDLDSCFERCRALTERSEEECFDACVRSLAPRDR